jgi:hypothetical protein
VLRNVEALPRTPALVPPLPQKTYEHCAGSSGALLSPSPPAEKATARQDQAGQASTGDGGGDGGGRNLWLLGIWLEHVLKNIPFHDRYKEFTDELTHAHVPELCLER